MIQRTKTKKQKTRLIIAGILLVFGSIIVLLLFSWLKGFVGLPIGNGWIYYNFFIENEENHAFLVFVPDKSKDPSTLIITIAHPVDYQIFSKSKQPLENLIHIHRIQNISKLTKEQHPIIVRYLYYWNEQKKNASWLKGSYQDPNITKHIFDASDNFKAFVAKINEEYNPSQILGYGVSFEGTAILALAEQNPDLFSGIATLSAPTISIALPQLKDNLDRISNIPLYFAYGEEDRTPAGKRLIDEERPFRNQLERIVKNYEYKIIPEVGHFLPDNDEKNALDWILKKKDKAIPSSKRTNPQSSLLSGESAVSNYRFNNTDVPLLNFDAQNGPGISAAGYEETNCIFLKLKA